MKYSDIAPYTHGSPQPLPLLFFHIPKTAGSSLRHTFSLVYGERIATEDFMSLHDMTRKHPDCDSFQGHIQFFPGEFALAKASHVATTVLRDPVERLISQYFQYRRANSFCNPIEAAASRLSLKDYLKWLGEHEGLNEGNKMCSALASLTSPQSSKLDARATLHFARLALLDFDVVGFTDNLDEYLDHLGRSCGCTFPEVGMLNSSSMLELAEIDDAARQLAESLCSLDLQLFSDARAQEHPVITEQRQIEPSELRFDRMEFGTGGAGVTDISCLPAQSGEGGADLHLAIHAYELVSDVTIGIAIKDNRGSVIFGTNTLLQKRRTDLLPGFNRVVFELPASIVAGDYELVTAIHFGITHHDGCIQWLEPATTLHFFQDGLGIVTGDAKFTRNGKMSRSDLASSPVT